VKEAILALRIESVLGKEQILELYLNEIYLGLGSYGVAAAALNYFGKPLDKLTVAEAAYLAALPKGPNNYHPFKHYQAALIRRNWVLDQMLSNHFITFDQYAEAKAEPLVPRRPQDADTTRAPYFAEDVRRWMMEKFGADAVYKGGLSVRTTVDPALQYLGERSLRDGLLAYDRRKGWRGPVAETKTPTPEATDFFARPNLLLRIGWHLAFVQEATATEAKLLLQDWKSITLKVEGIAWTGRKQPSELLKIGDIVYVSKGTNAQDKDHWELRQIPAVNGALVAMDPYTGRVLAMAGGFAYELSEYNRASQAARQPGSTFKPFVYLAAMEKGFTPATIVLDAPIVIYPGPGQPAWRPANYKKDFLGPVPLRVGVEQSRNLMTVRIARTIGIRQIRDVARRFDIYQSMPPFYSSVLGAEEVTLLKMTAAYAMLDNGGRKVMPTLIDRVQDRFGKTIWKHDVRDCAECQQDIWKGQTAPQIPDNREVVADPASVYQVVTMLEGVVKRGTAAALGRAIDKPLAGKTGTTNDYRDAWFVGFSPDLTVGVYIGHDQPKSLGRQETGSRVAVPVFQAFMAEALKDVPAKPFRIPSAIELVRVSKATGEPSFDSTGNGTVVEAFKRGQTNAPRAISDGQSSGQSAPSSGGSPNGGAVTFEDLGGIY
jgi:penicillin-binding protein 1A